MTELLSPYVDSQAPAFHLCHFQVFRCTLSIFGKNILPAEVRKGVGIPQKRKSLNQWVMSCRMYIGLNFETTIRKNRASLYNGPACMLHVA